MPGLLIVGLRRTHEGRERIYFFPVKTKQCSIAAAHTEEDIELTLRALEEKSAFLAAD
jgi:hypothetical protein